MAEDASKKRDLPLAPVGSGGGAASGAGGAGASPGPAATPVTPLVPTLAGAPDAPGGRAGRRGRRPGPLIDPAAEAEKNKVIHIVRRLQEEASQGRVGRKPWVAISLAAAVLLPTLVVALWMFGFAADRYVAEARFALRSNEPQAADVLGALSGMPASIIQSDSYIVSDFIHSREMVEALERRVGLRRVYAHPDADILTRLDPDVTLEGLAAYWKTRADVFYDSTKNTIAVEVEAFAPDDAARLAEAIVAVLREMVNDLSAQARRDAVGFAAGEVARAELRVRGARADMLAFRTAHNEFDPTATASATLALTSTLEAERSQLNSQLAAVSGYLSPTAPSVQMLKSRIVALGDEIARIQSQVSAVPASPPPAGQNDNPRQAGAPGSGPDSGPDSGGVAAAGLRGAAEWRAAAGRADPEGMASVVGRYQELLLGQEFAEKAYAAAQGSLERARAEAERSQSYLALYVHPSPAESPAYPRRGLAILVTFVLASVLWAIGALAALTIRDHMP